MSQQSGQDFIKEIRDMIADPRVDSSRGFTSWWWLKTQFPPRGGK